MNCGIENGLHYYGIRVPGRTTGWIAIDSNNVIVDIGISQECIGKFYNDEVTEVINKYIGQIIEV